MKKMSPVVQTFEHLVSSCWFFLERGGLQQYSLDGGDVSLGASLEMKGPPELPVPWFCLVLVVQDLSCQVPAPAT